ncbi:MAG: hypothetical protein J7604_02670 [Sporocytophaga sp.]|uniref:hypothetical protein n=1 Tax=Sporocytophaga sp. TaxID=2231183 RepID=UPI001B192EF5|nr:hypothetical protein [Sporocytophaga sp.]MBO9699082.1 hypothetical protein [Sporocytophaga sp.]
MKFTFREKDVSKLGCFLVFFFISFITLSQSLTEDSQFVNKFSESVLERNITFSWSGGSLADALNKIGAENEIKFSFSNSTIAGIKIPANNFSSTKFSDLLFQIFKNTGFNYVLVGRIVAVYKDEKNLPSKYEIPDSTAITPQEKKQTYNQVYTPAFTQEIPWRERKILKRLYREELRWAARYRRQRENRDTINSEKEKGYKPLNKDGDFLYFISTDLGLRANILKYQSNSQLHWKEDLLWKSKSETNVYPTLLFGINIKAFMIGAGLGFQNITIHNTFRDIKKEPPKPPPAPAQENSNLYITERYSLISIPISITYSKCRKNLWLGVGSGIRFNIVNGNEAMRNKLKKYYNDSTATKTYFDEYKKLTPELFVDVALGYKWRKRFLFTGGLTYTHSLNPIYENALYRLNANAIVFKAGFYYRFNLFRRSAR